MLKKKIIKKIAAQDIDKFQIEYREAIRKSTETYRDSNQEMEQSITLHRKNKVLFCQ